MHVLDYHVAANRSGVSNPLTDTVVVSVEKLEFDEWVSQDEDSSGVDVASDDFDARLHLDNMGADCGRIKVKYLTDDGDLIDWRASTPRCPGDNQHYDWAADVPAFSSGLIGQVEVIAQTRAGGKWNYANSTTLSTER